MIAGALASSLNSPRLRSCAVMVRLLQSDTPNGLKEAIEGRIEALASVHSLFARSRWTGAELGSVVEQELSPYSRDGERRTRIDGPAVMLKPDVAQAIAVALHELACKIARNFDPAPEVFQGIDLVGKD